MHTMIYYLKDNALCDGTAKTLAFNGATYAGTLTKANVWYAVYDGVDLATAAAVCSKLQICYEHNCNNWLLGPH